ncbi:RDD family protein [Streptomyces sp. Isolate_219]|uniref:RDD family protein n=1 Tax=Streptomyces sp. Isolate_219 TaxID=2950110 RepID=UPI0021C63179|nr:RDD family protein [Streptomyces sp. Isolate_219]MCR8578643.1 RDD family protein [Streptomyces sp. Isolate_219]
MTENPHDPAEQKSAGQKKAEHPPRTGPRPAPRWSQRGPASARAYAPVPAPTVCPVCGGPVEGELTCQFCGQVMVLPHGIHLSTVGLRFGGFLLENLLMICTLYIGWLIWAFLVFPQGQTPAKQLLHMRVIYIPEARAARWWRMFFREFIAKGIIGLLASVTLLIPYFWLLWDRNRQELWDKMATTLVITDPEDRLRPPRPSAASLPE